MHQSLQPAGASAFNPGQFAPGQFAPQGQFGATPFGNQSFGSQPGSTYGAPSAGFQPSFTDPSAAYALQPQLLQQQPQFAQPFAPPSFYGLPPTQQSQPFAPPSFYGLPPTQQSQPFAPPSFYGLPPTQQSQLFAPPSFYGLPPTQQSQPFAPPASFGLPPTQQSQPFGGAPQFARSPFLPDPTFAAYANQLQQAQLAQQFAQPNIPSASFSNPAFGAQFGAAQFPRPSPFFTDPLAAIYAQQLQQAQLAQQYTPHGLYGAPLPQFAQPFGPGIGASFANPALAAASQFGRYPPFATPQLH